MVAEDTWCYAVAVLALGCGGSVDVELILEGPQVVHVQRLGLVQPPPLRLSDGSVPDGVMWEVVEPAIAHVQNRGVHALGRGRTDVVGHWEGQQVAWTLVVDPSLQLVFDRAPATVLVGQTVPLLVLANDDPAPPQTLAWSVSSPEVLAVTAGEAQGIAPGVAYVTVAREGSRAMVEITVTEP